MEGCLQCGKELIHTPGRKKKKFCNEVCKGIYFKEHNPAKKLLSWAKELSEYCEANGILPVDLIIAYEKIKVSGIETKRTEPLVVKTGYSREQSVFTEEQLQKYLSSALNKKQKVKDLNKERMGEKGYNPNEETPRYKIVNGKKVFK